MKKILFLSLLIVSSTLMTSCTADAIVDATPASSTINADDPGGQGIPTPPKPPKPGTGTGG